MFSSEVLVSSLVPRRILVESCVVDECLITDLIGVLLGVGAVQNPPKVKDL